MKWAFVLSLICTSCLLALGIRRDGFAEQRKELEVSHTAVQNRALKNETYLGFTIGIVGGGPSGMFAAWEMVQMGPPGTRVFIFEKRPKKTRVRQTVVFKKIEGGIDLLRQRGLLYELMKQAGTFEVCVLHSKPDAEHWMNGPYVCLDGADIDSPEAVGFTITVASFENFLEQQLRLRARDAVTFLISDIRGPDRTKMMNKMLALADVARFDIIIGAGGGNGPVRNMIFQDDTNPLMRVGNQTLLQRQAWTPIDSYMVIVRRAERFPKLPTADMHEELAFGWTNSSPKSDKSESIILTSFKPSWNHLQHPDSKDEGQHAFIRQIYYRMDRNVFIAMSDCEFSQWCSLEEMGRNRITLSHGSINLPADLSREEKVSFLQDKFPGLVVRSDATPIIGKSLLSVKPDIATALRPNEVYAPGSRVVVKCFAWGTDQFGNIPDPLHPDLEDVGDDPLFSRTTILDEMPATIDSSTYLGDFRQGWSVSVSQIKLMEENVMARIEEVLSAMNLSSLQNSRDRSCHMFKPEQETNIYEQSMWHDQVTRDLHRFAADQGRRTDERALGEIQIIRIWTPFRYATKLWEWWNGDDIAQPETLVAIVGDESLLVDPMTGTGVTKGLISATALARALFEGSSQSLTYRVEKDRVLWNKRVTMRRLQTWKADMDGLREKADDQQKIALKTFVALTLPPEAYVSRNQIEGDHLTFQKTWEEGFEEGWPCWGECPSP